ncbi:glycosyltransferase family 4 protein [Ancylothrix sp. C2]|uniref:glycosyltransferase family 4 protein n=1 Tax=Ancylothrix sp. D3o TaxID=2953691 RepID=UPI0021BB7E2D|nr:glycosyltransferase family 4 protein [Ancylothrix sp. D3o]MCT7950027.1 glycosyltransferase family 4 protein [Ancylothrix sp. D3o]
MKILIVSQYFPPEPFRVGDLAVALQERGCQVTVLTGFPNYPKGEIYDGYQLQPFKREDYQGVSVLRVPLYPDTSYSKLKRISNYLSYAASASLLGPLLIHPSKYDRIITFQLSPVTIGLPSIAIKAAHFSKAPIYFWIQDIWPESLQAAGLVEKGLAIQLTRNLVNFLYHRSEKILVQSTGFIPKILEYGIPAEKIEFLPNWAEDLYEPVDRDLELAKRERMAGYFNVVFAGNVGTAQSLETVVKTAQMLADYPGIQFVILGDGANLEKLKTEAEGLTNICFKGRRPVETMPQYFALADALLVQLKRDPLFAITIPSKIQSYLACARPVIAGLEGSGAKVIEDAQAGVVCEPENPASLRDAVLNLYKMPLEQRQKLGENARQYYDSYFSRSRVIDRLIEIMKGGSNND